MKRIVLMLLLMLAASAYAEDDEARAQAQPPSYLVTSIAVHKGDLSDQIVAYGIVTPLPDGAITLSLLRAGQVDRLMVSVGQVVKQGDALLDFVSNPGALLSYEQAVSALAAAQEEQARIQQLVGQHMATTAQLARANKGVSDAQAALESERTQGGDKKTEALVAPFDGVITSVNVNSGDRVQANAPLLQLAHRGGLGVTLGLSLDEIAGVRAGDAVHLQSLDGGGPTIDGKVAVVSRILNRKTRLVNVIVALPIEKLPNVVQGEQFRAIIERGKFVGFIVPRSAVLKSDRGAYVFQIDQGKAIRVNVHVLGENGDKYAIEGQIDPQRRLVTTGNYELEEGDRIREGAASGLGAVAP